ncbi:MAG: hypothetical protein CM15mP32_2210 [Flavobacteriaceae bacterium]|nr:MAG: hypothetical protein CM15mP32_2210 [Flavobacteriaceae bacterium]
MLKDDEIEDVEDIEVDMSSLNLKVNHTKQIYNYVKANLITFILLLSISFLRKRKS